MKVHTSLVIMESGDELVSVIITNQFVQGHFELFTFKCQRLTAQKSKVKVTFSQRVPRLTTFQFEALVIPLLDICIKVLSCRHLA